MSDETQPKRTRRRQLMVAMGAGVSGAGLGWWLQRPAPQAQGSDADSLAALWALRLDRPEGGELVLADFRGKPLLINFWATWCPPCRKEFPSLGRVRKLFKPTVFEVLAVNVGEDPDAVFSFAGNTEFPVLFDHDAKAMAAWSVTSMPQTAFLISLSIWPTAFKTPLPR